MPVDLTKQPRRRYSRNPLTQVLCQIRFPMLQRFHEPGFLGPVQDTLRDSYPRSRQEQQIGLIIGPGGATPAPAAAQFWRFEDANREWSVVFGPDFMGVETTRYNQFEDFLERVNSMLLVAASVGVNWRERLGLRYVNQMRHDNAGSPAAWRQLLEPKFLGMVGGDELGEDVIHAIQEIRLREEDGVLLIRHGFVGKEAANGEPFYLLDIDCSDEAARELDVDDTVKQLWSYNDRVNGLFEMTLTDPMREYLGYEGVIE